jgi:hypothetical protein
MMQMVIPRWAWLATKPWSIKHGGPRCACEPLRLPVTRENYDRMTTVVRGEPYVVVHREYVPPVVGEPYLLLHLEPYERGALDDVPAADVIMVTPDAR